MGCFLACFGVSKKRKRLKSAHRALTDKAAGAQRGLRRSYQPLDAASLRLDVKENVSDVTCSNLKKEKPTLRSVLRASKKVSFNLKVRTYELIKSRDFSECDEEEKPFEIEKAKAEASKIKDECTKAYPSDYRYKNFVDCEDDDDVVEYSGSELDEEDEDEYDDCLDDYEEDFELDEMVTNVTNPNVDVTLENSVQGKTVFANERFRNAHSVLSPVENTAQWTAVKAKISAQIQPKHLCKESVENVASDNDTIHMSMEQEIRVEASLSNWVRGNGLKAPLLRTI